MYFRIECLGCYDEDGFFIYKVLFGELFLQYG